MNALESVVEGAILKRACVAMTRKKKGSRTEARPPQASKHLPLLKPIADMGTTRMFPLRLPSAKLRTIHETLSTKKHVIKHIAICYKTYF